MPYGHESDLTLNDLLRTLGRYRWRWISTAVLIGGAVAAYAVLGPRTWEASQAVTVRNVGSTRPDAPGEFRHEDEMKATQETLVQVAQSREVLRNALARVSGPRGEDSPSDPPTETAVDGLMSALTVAPPKGAEFGQTEIFYIKVKDRDRDRALQLVDAVFRELETALNGYRAARARSVIGELNETVALAEANLSESTGRLTETEQQVGADLIALRMLHQSPTGESDLYRTLVGTMGDLNRARVAEGTQAALLELLEGADASPEVLLSAPRELLDARPSLARLIQGLAEVRLRAATLAGTFTEADPRLIAARAEEQEVVRSIQQELAAAVQGVKASAKVAAAQRESLEAQVAELRGRVDRLTEVRAEYSNLAEQVELRRDLLAESERSLAEARASLAASSASSLLSRAGPPDGGARPVGPGRTTIMAAGVVGGIFTGFGLVFLTAPIARRVRLPGERALDDYLNEPLAAGRIGSGRRQADSDFEIPEPHANGHSLVG